MQSALNSSSRSACGAWYDSWLSEMVGPGAGVCAAAMEATGKCWCRTCEATCLAVSSTVLCWSACCPGCANTSLGVRGVGLGWTGATCLNSCCLELRQLAKLPGRSLIIPAGRVDCCLWYLSLRSWRVLQLIAGGMSAPEGRTIFPTLFCLHFPMQIYCSASLHALIMWPMLPQNLQQGSFFFLALQTAA